MPHSKNTAADVLVQTLVAAGVKQLFTLSGNQIMPLFNACIDAELDLIHVRHEAAAVHMADAWGRLTGEVGVALLTAGPGHANGVSALYTALAAESPLLLISGHAPRGQLGMGAFQEMPQAEIAGAVAKASWTVSTPEGIGQDLARAMRTALSGRPGPVHLSVPFDLLSAQADNTLLSADLAPTLTPLSQDNAQTVLDLLGKASQPLIFTGPALQRPGAAPSAELAAQLDIPVIGVASPRGMADPSLGALPELLPQVDLVVLLGKAIDFSLGFGNSPPFAADCQFIHIDPDAAMLERSRRLLAERLLLTAVASASAAVTTLLQLGGKRHWQTSAWAEEVSAAINYRPAEWQNLAVAEGPVHPAVLCRAIQPLLDKHQEAVVIADGGEFGQWAQACLNAPHRIINGPSGAIGAALPFALAARQAFSDAPIITAMGDGTVGFQIAEFDTAVRYQLPFIAVIGNDARWNAEVQIQLRDYGPERLIGCELRPTRYDQVAAGFGCHGENVANAAELPAALKRAAESGLPACVNVALDGLPAPALHRSAGNH